MTEMNERYQAESACGAMHGQRGSAAACIADWLGLAAAPIFGMMAWVTGAAGGRHASLLCSDMLEASPLSGMAVMYLLMCAFSLAPWLRLIGVRQKRAALRRSRDR